MTVSIQSTHIELTDTLRAFVEDKLSDGLRPLGRTGLVDAAVSLERTAHRYREHGEVCVFQAHATVTVRGTVFRAEAASDSIESAIVEIKHELTRQVRDWRSRRRDAQRRGARVAKQS